MAFGVFMDSLSTAPIPNPTLTPTYIVRHAPTSTPRPFPTSNPCLRWDQITVGMKGKTLCVRGIVLNLNQSNEASTRYEFSNKPNTFFLYSKYYEIYDPATGKTLGPGTCMEVTGLIQVISSVPYMDITNIKGAFSFDPSDCQ